MWIGAVRDGVKFKWDGKSTDTVQVALWGNKQPNWSEEKCVVSAHDAYNYLHDVKCNYIAHYICELVPGSEKA